MEIPKQSLLAVDMDDVLFDFLGEFFIWHNKVFGSEYSPADMVYAKLWEVWDGSKEEALERILRFWEEIDLSAMEPISGAKEALKELKKNYRLAVVSARFENTLEASQLWLDKYFGDVFDDVILGISDPMAQERQRSKAEVCVDIGAKLLIDDQLVHAVECSKVGIAAIVFGEQAHNQSNELPAGVRRVADWDEIVGLLAK
jgi:5'(3')-deoxyribonucleotidase